MTRREAEIQRRVGLLIEAFERYLVGFDEDPAFKKVGQLEKHVATITLRREIGSSWAAATEPTFLKLLHETLSAWGVGLRGSKLVPLDEFARAFGGCELALRELEGETLDDPMLDLDIALEELWKLVDTLRIVENEAKLVPCTKALHHLLPDLVVPLDRKLTRPFFGWHVPEFQYQQKRVFDHAYRHFARIGREAKPSRFIGSGWSSNRTKIIDNALVGFCRLENLRAPS